MDSLKTPGLSLNRAIRALADPAWPVVPPLSLPPAKPLTLKQLNDFWNLGQIRSPHAEYEHQSRVAK